MDIVTTAEAEKHLQLQSGSGGTYLASMIRLVSAKLARYTGRDDWGPATSRTEYHDGGSAFILPRYWPVTAFTLYEDIDHEFAADTAIDSEDVWATETGYLYYESGRFGNGVRNIKLVYSGGYATTESVPEQVKFAALIQLEREWNARKRSGRTVEAGVALEADSEVLPEVSSLLSAHTRRVPFV